MLTVSRNHATQGASMPKTQIMASSKPPVIQTASGALPVFQYAVASLRFYLIFSMLLVGYLALTLVGYLALTLVESLIVTMVLKISDWMFRDFLPNSTAPFRFHVNRSSSPASLKVFSFTPSGSSPGGLQSVARGNQIQTLHMGFVDQGPRRPNSMSSSPASLKVFSFTPSGSSPGGLQSVARGNQIQTLHMGSVDQGPRRPNSMSNFQFSSSCVREPEEESAPSPVFSRGFVDSGPRAEKR